MQNSICLECVCTQCLLHAVCVFEHICVGVCVCVTFLRDPAFQLKAESRPLFGALWRREKESAKRGTLQTFHANKKGEIHFCVLPPGVKDKTLFIGVLEDTYTPTLIQAHTHTLPHTRQFLPSGRTNTRARHEPDALRFRYSEVIYLHVHWGFSLGVIGGPQTRCTGGGPFVVNSHEW